MIAASSVQNNMARFASSTDLQAFLGRLDQDHAQYTPALWQKGVRRAEQLVNADKQDFIAAGVTLAIHAKDIKSRAGTQGQSVHTYVCLQSTPEPGICSLSAFSFICFGHAQLACICTKLRRIFTAASQPCLWLERLPLTSVHTQLG